MTFRDAQTSGSWRNHVGHSEYPEVFFTKFPEKAEYQMHICIFLLLATEENIARHEDQGHVD